jgi:DNA-binding response OmpR family regulator
VRSLLRAKLADGALIGIYDDGLLRIDLGKRRVAVAGENVRFTRKEFDLLKMLFAHKDRVVTRHNYCGSSGGRRTPRTRITFELSSDAFDKN